MTQPDPLASRIRERLRDDPSGQPPEREDRKVIDLPNRNLMRPRPSRWHIEPEVRLAIGVALGSILVALAMWSMERGRQESRTAALVASSDQQPVLPAPPVGGMPIAADGMANPMIPSGSPLSGMPQQSVLAEPPMIAPLPIPGGQSVLAAPPNAALLPTPGDHAGVAGPAESVRAPRNRHASPTVVFQAGGEALPLIAPDSENAGSDPAEARATGRKGGALAVTVERRGAVSAAKLTRGTLIPAVLETAVDSEVPGFVRAMVSADVRSIDGKQLLIGRSSRLIGQYRSGLQNGQRRATIVWTQLVRPDGSAIGIGTTAGVSDKAFAERMGSALLMSVLEGQAEAPIRVRQGEPVRVFAARDIESARLGSR